MDLNDLKIDRSSAKPRNRRNSRASYPVLISSIVAIVVAVIWGRSWIESLTSQSVEVHRVRDRNPAAAGAMRGAASNGFVVAARRAALSADTPGRITEMLVTEGSVVKRGDVVARLYAEEYEASLDRTEAEFKSAELAVTSAAAQVAATEAEAASRDRSREAAEADVRDARATVTLAESKLQRELELLEAGIASPDDVDTRREQFDRATAQLQAVEARQRAAVANVADAGHRVEAAKADLVVAKSTVNARRAAVAQAQATLDKTFVRAPFDGIVVLKDAEVGEVVSPNSQGGSNARGSVCTLVDFDSLEVEADVQETTIGQIDVGMPATIFLDAFPAQPYSGKVSRVWPTADRTKGTIEVRIEFDLRDDKLRPDMGVRVVFARAPEPTDGQREFGIEVPADCLVERDGDRGVFVLDDDHVRFERVEAGAADGDAVRITDGLRDGQLIVRRPGELRDGDQVVPTNR